jgi:voltage-gated potassium channel
MDSENKLGFLDITIIVLTFYVLGALVVETFWKLSPEIAKLLMYFDYVICGIFFIEFTYRFSKAESKLRFMKWG